MDDIRFIPQRAVRALTGLHRIPDLILGLAETHDMSQYIGVNPGRSITASQIIGLNPAIATYSHATKLLTAVAGGVVSGLQYEVTSELTG